MPRSARMVTGAQVGKLQGLYRDLGITDRAARLADASGYLARTVTTFNDLSLDEAKMLIDHLERRLR